MTDKEALKLALEALEANQPVNYCMNSNGERFPMMHEDPFRLDRNTKDDFHQIRSTMGCLTVFIDSEDIKCCV